MKRASFLMAAALLAGSVGAEEYGTTLTVVGDTPVAVMFLRCERDKRDAATETAPAVCRDRDTREGFFVETARVTNLGDTLVWVHVGEDKLPVLPGMVYDVWGSGPRTRFKRIFLSANPDETARVHVFASDPLHHARFPAQGEEKRPGR